VAGSTIRKVTQDFYEWEQHGRKWYTFCYTVDIESYFRPFFFHSDSFDIPDDGKRLDLLNFSLGGSGREKQDAKVIRVLLKLIKKEIP
jgi:hypothetical protein